MRDNPLPERYEVTFYSANILVDYNLIKVIYMLLYYNKVRGVVILARTIAAPCKMTSKERVMLTLNNREADRVPINYLSNPGINARLLKYFGLKPNEGRKLRDALGVDFLGVSPVYKGPRLHAEVEGRSVDPLYGIHRRLIKHQSGAYWDFCDFPLKEADEETVANWPMPSPDDYDYSHIKSFCDENSRYAIFAGGAGLPDIINSTGMVRSMEQVLVDLAIDDPAGLLLIDRKLKIACEVLYRTLEAAKGKIDFVWMGEDLGTQYSPLISMDLFRRHIRPRHQKVIDIAKSFGLPTMIHTCGSSSWAFEDFIEMGMNAVDTLQPEAANMSPEYLKKTFGGRLAFHGCISTAGPVAYGTVEEVDEYVKKTLDIMMPGGGYCLSPTHQLQDNSPTENVVAMYEAAHKYGRYSNT